MVFEHGTTYQVDFSNFNGERTEYFEKIIKGIVSEKITVSSDEKEKVEQLAQEFEKLDDSELLFRLGINQYYQPYMRKKENTNVLRISTKAGTGYNRNMKECSKLISEKYKIAIKKADISENFEDSEEFLVTQFDNASLEYYFKGNDFERGIEIINYVKSQERNLDTFESSEPDYDEYDFD